MKNPIKSLLLSAMAIVAVAPIVSATVLIDDFSAGTNFVTNAANGNLDDREGPLSGVVDSGYRNVVVRNFGAGQGTGNIGEVTGGVLDGTRGPGPDSSDFVIEYTGIANPGDGTWNFTGLETMTAVEVEIAGNTNAALLVSFQVVKWDAGFSNFVSSSSSSTYAAVGASTVSIDLIPLGLDTFGAIDQINVTFSYSPDPYVYNDTINQSFSVSSITAVPEPTSIALIGLGALTLIAGRRRVRSS